MRGRFAAAMIVSSAALLDRRPASGRRVERRVDVAVLRVGGCPVRLGLGEVADDRMARRASRPARAFSLSRTSAVTSCPPRTSASSTAAPMYAGRAGQKDPHRGPYIIIQPWPATRSSIFSTISRAPAATSSSTTTGSGAARYTLRRGRPRRARLRGAPARSRRCAKATRSSS